MGLVQVLLVGCALAHYYPLTGGMRLDETSRACDASERIELTNVTEDGEDGSIRYAGNTYPPAEYFRDPVDRRYYSCICARRKCLYVCCYRVDRSDCEESVPLRINRTLHVDGTHDDVEVVEVRDNEDYWLIYADTPEMGSSDRVALQIPSHEGVLNQDGTFTYSSNTYRNGMFCLNPTNDSQPFVVIMDTDDYLDMHRWHSLGMIVSLPFLVATLAIYALLPELRNVPGKSLMCYVSSLTVSYVMLILVKRSLVDGFTVWCTVVGFLCYLSVLSSFFWLNLMAFDIYWTFGGHRRHTASKDVFPLYCTYAFGCPLLFLSLALLADYGELLHTDMRPGVGEGQCLIRPDTYVAFAYLYLPMLILLTVNMFFFVRTAVKICTIERATASALQGESRRHGAYAKERNRYGLYLRLFVVMGITWISEFITWRVGSNHWLVYVVDIGNCVTGVFIFSLFVLKRKVWLLLQQRFRGKKVAQRAQQPLSVSAPSRMTSVTQ